MNPNNVILTPDYLNQISSPSPLKKKFFNRNPILLGGAAGVILLIFIIIFGIISSGAKPAEKLALNLLSTQSVAEKSSTNIKSTQLRTLNGNLKIYFTNTIRDITPLLASDNVKIEKMSKKIEKDQDTIDLLARLEDARLNALFDRTYAREMSFQLDTTMLLMKKIYSSTGSKKLKTFLEESIANLEPTQKKFADFNAANS